MQLIRGIWGEGRGHSDDNLERTALESKDNNDPVDKVYCFGKENKDRLERCGHIPEMLGSDPWPKGISHWHQKLRIIEYALRDHDSVLWQDFDVRLIKPLPTDYWDVMESGAKVRALLVVTRSRSRGARSRWWHEAARLVPAGGFLYIRGLSTIQEIIAIHKKHPRWDDQAVLAAYTDGLQGGWVDGVHYIRAGHNIEGYFYAAAMYPPAPEDTYWISGIRRKHPYLQEYKEWWQESQVLLTVSRRGQAINMEI